MPYDIPYLADTDAQNSLTGYYWAAGTTDVTKKWPGAVLQMSHDGINFASVDSTGSPAIYGNAQAALVDAPDFWCWDMSSTLLIKMVSGTLASTPDAQVYAGANAMLVGNEVIQFATAQLISAGYYVISRLLRGRRNTEYNSTGHASGEACLLLSDGNAVAWGTGTGVRRVRGLPLTQLVHTRFKAVTIGRNPSSVAPTYLTLVGNDLRPAAPVHLTGSVLGGDWTIGWTRRTRYGGRGVVGPTPLYEASEAYEIDILDVPGGTVKRTITWSGSYDSNSLPTQVYTAAQQTTDFGGAQTTIYVAVYQLSEDVGRGQVLAGTLTS